LAPSTVDADGDEASAAAIAKEICIFNTCPPETIKFRIIEQ